MYRDKVHLIDKDRNIIASLHGRPPRPASGPDDWMTEVCDPAYEELLDAARELDKAEPEPHRRGRFRALASGISFGGGQKVRVFSIWIGSF
jgi:hypothetical protein